MSLSSRMAIKLIEINLGRGSSTTQRQTILVRDWEIWRVIGLLRD